MAEQTGLPRSEIAVIGKLLFFVMTFIKQCAVEVWVCACIGGNFLLCRNQLHNLYIDSSLAFWHTIRIFSIMNKTASPKQP